MVKEINKKNCNTLIIYDVKTFTPLWSVITLLRIRIFAYSSRVLARRDFLSFVFYRNSNVRCTHIADRRENRQVNYISLITGAVRVISAFRWLREITGLLSISCIMKRGRCDSRIFWQIGTSFFYLDELY